MDLLYRLMFGAVNIFGLDVLGIGVVVVDVVAMSLLLLLGVVLDSTSDTGEKATNDIDNHNNNIFGAS